MDGHDLQLLVDYLKANNLTRRIWILGLPSEAVEDVDISDVTIIDKDGIVYHKTINLSKWIDKTEVPVIFQDVIRFK